MADDDFPAPPTRLMNFVSEGQLDEAKRSRGARIEDGTAQRDRSLFEILKENKDKKDTEFNERFKHRPPKALDDDETEFLDKLEMSRKEYERQMADDEAQQLQSFQAAVAAQSTITQELKELPSDPKVQDLSMGMMIGSARMVDGLYYFDDNFLLNKQAQGFGSGVETDDWQWVKWTVYTSWMLLCHLKHIQLHFLILFHLIKPSLCVGICV
ncbi:uncharacterized protein LOC132306086 isoform X3 [Cornus florida]|uniref:uncharacterized protein LOC132306086 isoform X3 n=1 Tax=Cornus florida TaxID=4283 RepID=UPI0028A046B3|nr:uncharacterized protein LOC132306086 isoform X3 [Cornus florida]